MIGFEVGGRLRRLRARLGRAGRAIKCLLLYRKYRGFTMAQREVFLRNMLIVDSVRHVKGCVVECGVWRGGMSAGMAEVLGPARTYVLFDSFEGLPAATERDGEAARRWQSDTTSETYYDNCSADITFAQRAMSMSGAPDFVLVRGWFEETLRDFAPPCPIAVLRLDGDWYESTTVALEELFRHVAPGGIVIVDDYYAWDGCSRAVHDFLSRNALTARLTQRFGICVIEPRAECNNGSPAEAGPKDTTGVPGLGR